MGSGCHGPDERSSSSSEHSPTASPPRRRTSATPVTGSFVTVQLRHPPEWGDQPEPHGELVTLRDGEIAEIAEIAEIIVYPNVTDARRAVGQRNPASAAEAAVPLFSFEAAPKGAAAEARLPLRRVSEAVHERENPPEKPHAGLLAPAVRLTFARQPPRALVVEAERGASEVRSATDQHDASHTVNLPRRSGPRHLFPGGRRDCCHTLYRPLRREKRPSLIRCVDGRTPSRLLRHRCLEVCRCDSSSRKQISDQGMPRHSRTTTNSDVAPTPALALLRFGGRPLVPDEHLALRVSQVHAETSSIWTDSL